MTQLHDRQAESDVRDRLRNTGVPTIREAITKVADNGLTWSRLVACRAALDAVHATLKSIAYDLETQGHEVGAEQVKNVLDHRIDAYLTAANQNLGMLAIGFHRQADDE